MPLDADILETLRACYATETPYRKPLNIVDLGLVESVDLALDLDAPGAGIPGVDGRHSLTLTLRLPPGSDDVRAQLEAQISNVLAGLPQISRRAICFVATPRWTEARISQAGRRVLGLDATVFPILNNRLR